MTSQGAQRIRDSLIGSTLQGEGGTKFHLRALLGEGGQGWVFKANYDDPDGFWIVVKILRPEGLSQDTIERFERETRVLQMLGAVPAPNPNIIRFYDHGLHRMELYSANLIVPFIALEYVEGPTLGAVLDTGGGRGLPLLRTMRVMKQVARALATVHEHRIVHRDLKPSNILLATQHGQEVAKVTDFGLVKAPGLSAKATATIAGATLGYAPPEQYEMGNNRVSAQTDIFSFAAILYEVLSGRVAFPHTPGDSPLKTVALMLSGPRPQLAKDPSLLPQEVRARHDAIVALDREIARATAPDPTARHATLLELWNAVETILKGVMSGPVDIDDAVTIPQPPKIISAPMAALGSQSGGRFSQAAHPIPRERLRTGTIAEDGAVYAVGLNGLYRCTKGSWTQMSLPPSLDVRRVRGVAPGQPGELVVFGESGLAAVLGPGAKYRPLAGVEGDYNWLGAFTEDGDCLLAGERRSRAIGAIAEVGSSTAHIHTLTGTTKLHAVTRLASGTLLGSGAHGDLVQIRANGHVQVPWGRTGHLFSVARTNTGGAFAVGSGGHALAITTRTAIGTEINADLVATLEAVQTTRDLTAVVLEPDGTPWAVGQSARLLKRVGGVWTRIPIEGSANFIALRATERLVTVLADDGTVLEGRAD